MTQKFVKLEDGKTMSVRIYDNGTEALVVRDENGKILQAKAVNFLKKTKQI